MKKITTLIYKQEVFEIYKRKDGWYLAINRKYIKDGRLTKTLDGFEMNASKELNDCIETTKRRMDIEELRELGWTELEIAKWQIEKIKREMKA